LSKDGIRCQYHGWKFDETGSCIEQPFEDTTHPEDNFRDKCGIRAYRVEELGGLIFAYMGPDPAPLLPRWGNLVWDNCVRDIVITHLPCNWVNARRTLRLHHNEHLRLRGNYSVNARWRTELEAHPQAPQIGYDTYKYGIIKRRVTEDRDEPPRWRIGHSTCPPTSSGTTRCSSACR
jgi:5,5'-dehydrodivanillate O-demethylase